MCSCTQRKSRSDTHAHTHTHSVVALSPLASAVPAHCVPRPLYPAQFRLHAANRTNREQVCDTGWAALFWARPLAPCPPGSDSHWVSGSGEGGIHPLSSLGAGWGGKGQPGILRLVLGCLLGLCRQEGRTLPLAREVAWNTVGALGPGGAGLEVLVFSEGFSHLCEAPNEDKMEAG